ncbi:MAG: hypothetical protein IPH26_22975 [Sterolibacteriaceae bacterium]|uniref:MoaB/Mog domain-containing protein n=1 Tax=Candidatus Methylophosphatis roskildensis TaxID=2899263 RepID=A0A9D7E818_9PROT|nr:hypothetical protein [Candidatus Methylophosphatis roskildensis]
MSLSQQPAEGQIFDGNRYTIYAMLAQFGVDIIDMGVVPDDRARLEAAFREAIRTSDDHHSMAVSVGERISSGN